MRRISSCSGETCLQTAIPRLFYFTLLKACYTPRNKYIMLALRCNSNWLIDWVKLHTKQLIFKMLFQAKLVARTEKLPENWTQQTVWKSRLHTNDSSESLGFWPLDTQQVDGDSRRNDQASEAYIINLTSLNTFTLHQLDKTSDTVSN